jgi:hypothetical protein
MSLNLRRPFKRPILFSFLLFFCHQGIAQNISGYIQNSENEPIPYVNIFVNQLGSGTTTDEEGYYFLNIEPGEYEFIFSA